MTGRLFLVGLMASMVVTACSLAGDVTPPPAVATAQAEQGQQAPSIEELPPQGPTVSPPQTAADIAAGKAIYAERCAACHGTNGMGDGPQAANLTVPVAALGDPAVSNAATGAAWYDIITRGRIERFMPPFVSLSDQQRWDVAAYALSLSTDAVTLADGERIFEQECSLCHGELGAGTEAGPALNTTERLARQSMEQALSIVRQGQGKMPEFATRLSAEEQLAVAAYARSLSLAAPPIATAVASPTALSPQATTTPEADAGITPTAAASGPETFTPTADPVEAVLQATIRGTITNGTQGGQVPEGLPVVLYAFDGEQQVISMEASLDSEGRFAFDELEIVPGRIFFVTAEKDGITYASEVAHLLPAQAELDLPVVIFDATQSTDAVRIDRLHTLFDFAIDGQVRVIQFWILSNLGDTTIASPEGTLRVSLPDGATDLQFEGGTTLDRFLMTDDGFADTEPLAPGEAAGELVFSYSLPYSRSLDFEQRVDYPVQAVVLLSPEPGPRVEAEGLQDLGERQISTGVVRTYGLGSVAPGEAVRVSLRGRPASVGTGGSLPPNLAIALGLGALGVALIVAGLFWFRPRKSETQAATAGLEADGDELLTAIARLDDEYAAGSIPEEAYRSRRAALKQSLLDKSKYSDD